MQKKVIANWKANGSLPHAYRWLEETVANPAAEVVLCPPAHLLSSVAPRAQFLGVGLGAQDCSAHPAGAFTGELPAELLAFCGCKYLIIGHSERRHVLGENPELLLAKAQRALAAKMSVIYCVGENLAEREADATFAVLDQQLQLLNQAGFDSENLVLAYEPVWAIGTGVAASAAQAHEVHAFLQQWLVDNNAQLVGAPLLYGGSVKADNCQQLSDDPNVHGFLVGGAGLQAKTFNPIISCL